MDQLFVVIADVDARADHARIIDKQNLRRIFCDGDIGESLRRQRKNLAEYLACFERFENVKISILINAVFLFMVLSPFALGRDQERGLYFCGFWAYFS